MDILLNNIEELTRPVPGFVMKNESMVKNELITNSPSMAATETITESQPIALKRRAARQLGHLDALESEAIHIMREVAAECTNPALLFSGGKDSIVLLRLAEKAFRPGRFPFPIMHVDTGHNFPEVIEFRDRRVEELGEQLIVASVQASIDSGRAVEEGLSRNRLQTVT